MSNNLPVGLPLFSKIADPKATANVRAVWRDIVLNDNVLNEMAPHLVNGGVCGDPTLDFGKAADIGINYDSKNGNRLQPFNLNLKGHSKALATVLRERYDVDSKTGKIVGLSKRVLLAQPKPAAEPPTAPAAE